MNLRFVWDEAKNRENKRKHGISFEEATTIFGGFPLEIYYDPDHSVDEERYIAVGFSERNRVLLVVRCENDVATEIRIISARKASVKERRDAFGGTS
jgi:uncharacterized DUF497 family protein